MKLPKNHPQPTRPNLPKSIAALEPSDGVYEVDVGGRIRHFRRENSLSIRALADQSGLNVNTLSLIENGKTSPSISTLQQIAAALRVPMTAFFENETARQRLVFQQAGQRPRADFSSGVLEDLGAGLTLRGGQPLLVTLHPGASSGPNAIVHTGFEFVYCLEGLLSYTVEDRNYLLSPGDSLIFEAHLPHSWMNAGAADVRSLLIICPVDDNDRPTVRHFATEEVSL